MKKNLLLAALVGVALTGCVNDEVASLENQKKQLTFKSVMKTQSRANQMGEVSGIIYPEVENFHVYAWTYTGNFAALNDWSQLEKFFSEKGEDTQRSGDLWTTLTPHYWPSTAYNLMFAAYSPSSFDVKKVNEQGVYVAVEGTEERPVVECTPEISYDQTGITIEDFKVQSVADYQYDLMYSDFAVDRNINNSGQSVALIFNHALSSIVFSAAKTNADIDYLITKVQITGNLITSGTFNQNYDTEGEATPTWTFSEEDRTACVYKPTFTPFNVENGAKQFTSGNSALLLIPQTVPEDAEVELFYTKISATAELEGSVKIKLNNFIVPASESEAAHAITEWKPGHRYVYNISFGANKQIFFAPTVAEWKNGGQADYTISY